MKLKLIREEFTDKSTIGALYIDDKFFCFTLEDCCRQRNLINEIIPWSKELKVSKQTAIPFGIYKVIINMSNRFKKLMPLIVNVPNFEGIRIHSGNTAEDTEGCILLGQTKSKDFIGNSRAIFEKFFAILQNGIKEGNVIIEIK